MYFLGDNKRERGPSAPGLGQAKDWNKLARPPEPRARPPEEVDGGSFRAGLRAPRRISSRVQEQSEIEESARPSRPLEPPVEDEPRRPSRKASAPPEGRRSEALPRNRGQEEAERPIEATSKERSDARDDARRDAAERLGLVEPRPEKPKRAPKPPVAPKRVPLTAHENAILACADETGTPVALLDTRAALIFSQHMYARTARAEDAAGKVMVALEKKLLELEAEEGGAWMTREELRQNKGSTAQSAVSGPSKYELSDRTLLALRILFLGFARRDWAKVDLACGVSDPEQCHIRLCSETTRLSWLGFQQMWSALLHDESKQLPLLSAEEARDVFLRAAEGDDDVVRDTKDWYASRHHEPGLTLAQMQTALLLAAHLSMTRPPYSLRQNGQRDPRLLMALLRTAGLEDPSKAQQKVAAIFVR